MEYYDLANTGPEVQERLDLVPITKADLDQEVLDRIEGDQRVLAESRAYCDIETARAMQVEANLQAQIDAIVGSRLTITVSKDVGIIYVGVPTTINFVVGTSMDVTSCKLMRGDVEVASSDVPGSNFAFADTLTVASDIGRVSYSVIAVLGGIERIQPVEIPVEKQTPAFAWNPAGDVTVTEGQYTPSDFPTLVNVPTGLTVVCSSSNPAVATVNSAGVVTVIGVGECTIKAESQATDVYKAKSVSYKLTVASAVLHLWEVNGWRTESMEYYAIESSEQSVHFLKPNDYVSIDYKYRDGWGTWTVDGTSEKFQVTRNQSQPYDTFSVPRTVTNGGTFYEDNYLLFALVTYSDGTTKQYDLDVTVMKKELNFAWSADMKTIESVVQGVIPSHLLPTLVGDDNDNPEIFFDTTKTTSPQYAECFTFEDSSQYALTANFAGSANVRARIVKSYYYKQKTVSYRLTINEVIPSTVDYFIGWSKGTSFDDFAAMTPEQLVALSESYNQTVTPSTTKTVTAADVSNVTREIFILMWKEGSAPTGGSMTSGGITGTFTAQDFLDTNIFNATHTDVVIDGETFHVVGMRGNFNAGDSFTIRFN